MDVERAGYGACFGQFLGGTDIQQQHLGITENLVDPVGGDEGSAGSKRPPDETHEATDRIRTTDAP